MGEMREKTDVELLRDYAEHGHEAAFRELVMRYTELVYSAALRQLESADQAADITQGVFVDLARKARPVSERLAAHNSLAGWLHRSTRYAVLNHLRDTRRRVSNERQAMEQLLHNSDASVDWEQIRPALDEALDSLGDEDRDAVLLRYFKNHDLRTVGTVLGITDDAAQKRVSRAVERLREFFAKRGVSIGAGGLVAVVSANAVQAAPVGLALTISSAAALGGTAVATAATATATKAIAMTTLQKTIIGTTLAVAVGTGIYEDRQASQLRDQVQTLQRQQAPLAEQNEQLTGEREDAIRRLTALRGDNERLNRNTGELLRLRGEVARLRADAESAQRQIAKLQAANDTPQTTTSWRTNEIPLKRLLELMPDQKIPELALLNDTAYLDVARDFDLDSSEGIKGALSSLRFRAENQFALRLQRALQLYKQGGQESTSPTLPDLTNYFDPPLDADMLARYQVVSTGTNIIAGWQGGWVVTQKSAVDPERDRRWSISPAGFSPADFKWPEQKTVLVPRKRLETGGSGPKP